MKDQKFTYHQRKNRKFLNTKKIINLQDTTSDRVPKLFNKRLTEVSDKSGSAEDRKIDISKVNK